MPLCDPRSELIAAAGHFYTQGWMVGTAGNLSARLPDGSFWITASGKSKGNLNLEDFVLIHLDGRIESPSGLKPAAETAIHQALYTRFPNAQACYHVHSVAANLVSRFVAADNLPLPPLEMLKGLGIWEENPHCTIPIFANHLDVTRIATDIDRRFQIDTAHSVAPGGSTSENVDSPQIPALLLRDHGLSVWAPSTAAARNFVELLEYIFRYMIIARQIKIEC